VIRTQQVERLKQAIKDHAEAEHGTRGPWGRLYEREAKQSAARLDSITRNCTDEERAAVFPAMLRDISSSR
jgi:hypothetical protein